nr:tRNA lysidine(34) synthetase TilS [Aureimonas sp. ME7]
MAVSGGPDSLALFLAAAELRSRAGFPSITVATVDHCLRPESAAEANYVASVCRELRLPHRTLSWERRASLTGNLQAAAREARYDLLTREARRISAGAVVTAHHADDQLETHCLARQRGGTGTALAGMRTWRDLAPGLVLLRPFLRLPKAELAARVRREGLTAIDDPSNRSDAFARVRLRHALASGLYDRRLLDLELREAQAARREADAELARSIAELCLGGAVRPRPDGALELVPRDAPNAFWKRVLVAVGGGEGAIRTDAVERLLARFGADGKADATLGGCRIRRVGEKVIVAREFGRTGPADVPLRGAKSASFDRRFDITLPRDHPIDTLRAYGNASAPQVRGAVLPVGLDRDGAIRAVHPGLAARFPELGVLAASERIGWRIWADLPGRAPDRLTP